VLSHPAINAVLNATCAVLLCAGFLLIRRKQIVAHRIVMSAAFLTSATFLASYLLYHYRVGSVRFQGQGWIRPVYFALLLTHTVLAAAILPMALVTLARALRENFDGHRRIARWTLPIWLYVSVTGVIIYWLLYHAYGPVMIAPEAR
jgi:uncharacterized membrane protein YozB (DUF420 family)